MTFCKRYPHEYFDFRDQLISDYASYIKSFIQIRDPRIGDFVRQKLQEGVLWAELLIQLNPLFARGASIDELVAQGMLHRECARIFRKEKSENDDRGRPLRLQKNINPMPSTFLAAARVMCSFK